MSPQTRRRRRPLPVRTRGTGSIFPEGKYFRAQVQIQGETLRHRALSFESAEQWLNDLVSERMGSSVLGSRTDREVTVSAYGAQWLERKRPGLSPKTVAVYEGALRLWINPVLGSLRIASLRRPDIRRFTAYLSAHPGGRQGKTLSYSSQCIQWRVLKTLLRSAVNDDIVPRHYLHPDDQPIKPYGMPVSNILSRAIPDHLLGMIISRLMTPEWECSVENHKQGRCRAGWVLRISSGVRQGEYLALISEDITLQPKITATGTVYPGVLRLHSHAARVPFQHGCSENSPCGHRWGSDCEQRTSGGMVAIPGLKSHRNDERRLHIPSSLGIMIHQHMEAMGVSPRAFIFGDGLKMLSPEQDTRRWKGLLAASGVSAPYRIHDLRHTAITNAANQVSLVHAQQIAGHSLPATTRQYIHPSVEWTISGMEQNVALLVALGKEPLFLVDESAGEML